MAQIPPKRMERFYQISVSDIDKLLAGLNGLDRRDGGSLGLRGDDGLHDGGHAGERSGVVGKLRLPLKPSPCRAAARDSGC